MCCHVPQLSDTEDTTGASRQPLGLSALRLAHSSTGSLAAAASSDGNRSTGGLSRSARRANKLEHTSAHSALSSSVLSNQHSVAQRGSKGQLLPPLPFLFPASPANWYCPHNRSQILSHIHCLHAESSFIKPYNACTTGNSGSSEALHYTQLGTLQHSLDMLGCKP